MGLYEISYTDDNVYGKTFKGKTLTVSEETDQLWETLTGACLCTHIANQHGKDSWKHLHWNEQP